MWLTKTDTQWSIAAGLATSVMAISVMAVSLAGCASSGGSKPDSGIQPIEFAIGASTIATIKQSPQINAIVQIKGRVSNRAPLLGKAAYELQDPTGSIWILTTGSLPNLGDELVLKGKLLYRSIQLNGKEQGSLYIEQQQELQRTPTLKSDRLGERLKDKG